VEKRGSGFKVVNKETGKTYSKKPQTKAKAAAQARAMYANMPAHEQTGHEINHGSGRKGK
jgi:hypothetical protein